MGKGHELIVPFVFFDEGFGAGDAIWIRKNLDDQIGVLSARVKALSAQVEALSAQGGSLSAQVGASSAQVEVLSAQVRNLSARVEASYAERII